MDYGFPIYRQNKTRKKVCWLQIYAGIIIWRLFQCCRIIPVYWWVGQCLVLFYNHFHYRIHFNDFRYEIRFWWSVNGFWYEKRIKNKSSPSWFVTPSDKSFLLWKWNLWCIIWFSLWKWLFILYDSCVSRGAPAPFHFMVSSGRRESETLVCLYSRNYISPKSILYVDIWIYDCWSTVNPILQFTNL